MLIFDKSVPVTEQRLRVALAKPKRKHPKRHATGDHARASKKKRAAAKRRNAAKLAEKRKYKARVAAYWRGELSEHP